MTHVRELDEILQGQRERLELRLTEAMDLLKQYRESLDGLVWQFENYYGHVLEDVTIKGAKEALDIPIPEWMKERLK